MKLTIATIIIACAIGASYGQSPPTLRIVTETPSLPSELFYGDVKVKPFARATRDEPAAVHYDWPTTTSLCNSSTSIF
jgi:hypothetical protein